MLLTFVFCSSIFRGKVWSCLWDEIKIGIPFGKAAWEGRKVEGILFIVLCRAANGICLSQRRSWKLRRTGRGGKFRVGGFGGKFLRPACLLYCVEPQTEEAWEGRKFRVRGFQSKFLRPACLLCCVEPQTDFAGYWENSGIEGKSIKGNQRSCFKGKPV